MEDKDNQPNLNDNTAVNSGNVVGPAAPSAPDMPASQPVAPSTPPVASEPAPPLAPAPSEEHKGGFGKLVKRFVTIVGVLFVLVLVAIFVFKI